MCLHTPDLVDEAPLQVGLLFLVYNLCPILLPNPEQGQWGCIHSFFDVQPLLLSASLLALGTVL